MTDTDRPTILVTNDDGIGSVGLGVLARAMTGIGEVTVVAPDSEYSGAGAAIGPLHLAQNVVTRVEVDGIDAAWTVNGPPGLCVFYARMGAFGFTPDLVVSGINPGANLGRAVYHSGTIGAALTGRNGGIPGIAVSQSFADPIDDSDDARMDYDGRVKRQLWDAAAEVAVSVVRGMLDTDFPDVAVLNLNVPNRPVEEIAGWRWTEVGLRPPWSITGAELVPREDGDGNRFSVEPTWGDNEALDPATDSAAIVDGQISVSVLSRISAVACDTPEIDANLDKMLGR